MKKKKNSQRQTKFTDSYKKKSVVLSVTYVLCKLCHRKKNSSLLELTDNVFPVSEYVF